MPSEIGETTRQMVCESNGHTPDIELRSTECEGREEDSTGNPGRGKMIKPTSWCSEPRARRYRPFVDACLSVCWSVFRSTYTANGRTKGALESQELTLSEVNFSSDTHTANVSPVSLQPRDRLSSGSSLTPSSARGLTLPVESRKEMAPPPTDGACPSGQYDPIRSEHRAETVPASWERDIVLRVELWDLGRGCGEPRYRIEWELSEGFRLLRTGVWLSRTTK
ncbi:hypothetical protein AAFF_G00403500 [Aldrovandia affinis]|uniref:Uncharacterized protein n=1 Tax=Aldrovandia affinis TaxID=143900 RepID=A0AAD7T7S8_9TELE|nr:hypothetical protein AAFF_G00403500 [Aldrovandia affinis]